MTPRGSAPGVRQSECRVCPDWVVRCAHLDGTDRAVWITDGYSPAAERFLSANTPLGSRDYRYGIRYGSRLPSTPNKYLAARKPEYANDRAEADAAFARFEAQLLGREEAS